ncbi:DUF7221 family queuine tRNA-ribosyltransferase-like protein [Natronosalvus rutilus]|uniref:DeoxyPurine in DNA protein A domain-containing protein n=1 Tax=Natronosalvus rutilus TaxID=2953753 RepID=A0A9E7SXC4_9EURY|nr:hypothetical protein [Natronosalvus rutilus]UTF56022.1 hypothetical protein NGM29_20765 [Natronosalvus rutilus]
MIHDNLRFFWTVSSGGSRKALREAERDDTVEAHGQTLALGDVPAPESCMVSFATRANKPWPGPEWFIDSGGYSTLLGNSEYEDPIREYLEFIREHEQRDGVTIDRYALRDWACESKVLRKHGRTARQHQEWTIRDHVECLELAEEIGVEAEPVSVLQGYTVPEYLEHLDYYREHGLLSDHVGIGSVCRRNADEEIRSTILQVSEALPDRCRLHAFGVKKTVLRFPDVVMALDSVDSNAWDYAVRMDAESNASTEGHRYTWDRITRAYQSYRADVLEQLDAVDGDGHPITVKSLADFTDADLREKPYPIAKCRCGELVNPNYLADQTGACRYCDRLILTLRDHTMNPDHPMYDPETAPLNG